LPFFSLERRSRSEANLVPLPRTVKPAPPSIEIASALRTGANQACGRSLIMRAAVSLLRESVLRPPSGVILPPCARRPMSQSQAYRRVGSGVSPERRRIDSVRATVYNGSRIPRVYPTHWWRGGRVAEGGGLLNRYTAITRIVGSNPIPSATLLN
jgi:hypothetical protein